MPKTKPQSLSRPPMERMMRYRVSKLVNNAKHDSPECVQPG